ncbi:MAG: hypothetical protein JNK05_34805 [Myxococcales bacterium]|nr:hypothetical protein [Myxococcales bacterium]
MNLSTAGFGYCGDCGVALASAAHDQRCAKCAAKHARRVSDEYAQHRAGVMKETAALWAKRSLG